jgi:hypothetical protein
MLHISHTGGADPTVPNGNRRGLAVSGLPGSLGRWTQRFFRGTMNPPSAVLSLESRPLVRRHGDLRLHGGVIEGIQSTEWALRSAA